MTRSPHLSRRQLLAGGAAALGVGALAGCATGPGGGPAEDLAYWTLLSGGDGENMTKLVDRVNAKTDRFSATQTVLAWGTPYYTKLAMASVGGRAPDVAIMHASRLAGYAPGGLLDPWDEDELAKYGVTEKDFPAAIWKRLHSDDKLYAVALDTHPFVLYYNTDIADKAGVLDSDGRLQEISSPDDFRAVAQAIGGQAKGHALSYGYLGDGSQMWRLFYGLYRQHGAEMSLVPGQKPEYDEGVAVDTLKFMQSLLDGKIAAKGADGGNATAEFSTGQSGMFFGGVWELPTMKAAKLPFDVEGIPTMFGTPAAYADSHTFVLPHQTNADPEKRADTYRFVTSLLKISASWADGGHIPAYIPATKTDTYKNLDPQSHYADVAQIVNYNPAAWFTGAGGNFESYFAEYAQGVLLQGQDPAKGFRDFMGRITTLLQQPNPVAVGGKA